MTMEKERERTLTDCRRERERVVVLLPMILFMSVRMQDGDCANEREERDMP